MNHVRTLTNFFCILYIFNKTNFFYFQIKTQTNKKEEQEEQASRSSSAYKTHSDLNDGQRVRGLLGYLCNDKNAYPNRRTHTVYGRYADRLKNMSNNDKADRMYIKKIKKYLPESVRTALQMDRWNDKGTWP